MGWLDDAARETVQSLSDLARLAIEHRELHEEVLHRSQYDRLTGLPNRLLLEDRLRQAMVIARRQGTLVGVCCIDLDRFKQINESLGHEAGDAFFKLVSERLHGSIREIDTLARQCGDEFILALRDLAEISDAVKICDRLLKRLERAFSAGGPYAEHSRQRRHQHFSRPRRYGRPIAGQCGSGAAGGKTQWPGPGSSLFPGLGRESRRAAEMVEALVRAVAEAQFRIAYSPSTP